MNGQGSVVHLNVTDFAAAVAIAKDGTLADSAFVVAKASASRAVIQAVSQRAWQEGLVPGMTLANAQRLVKGLKVLPPDPISCAAAHQAMKAIADRYTPVVQNDCGGHLYLDLSGTTALFGPHFDCAVRIRNEIVASTGLVPTVAVASNKLVAKVATRAVRPSGIAGVRPGEEALFLAPQDALLLPGVGPAMARIISVAGLREIGSLAALDDNEAIALFGRRGVALRDAALGRDASTVEAGDLAERTLRRTIDFPEPVFEQQALNAALTTTVEDMGLELRQAGLATAGLNVAVLYADGVRTEASERLRRLLLLDIELVEAATRVVRKATNRRVRIRGLMVAFFSLDVPSKQIDLFTPEGPSAQERFQHAVDRTRLRFGPEAVTLASALFHG